MRILHSVAPAEFGGLEEVVWRLTHGLRTRGHDVQVAAFFTGPERSHPVTEALRGSGVPVHARFLPARGYRSEIAELRSLARTLAPQVLHTHGYRPDAVHPRAVRPLRIPVVTTLHGFTGGGFKNRLYEWLQVRSCRSKDAVIAVSNPIAERVEGAGVPEERIHVIPNAWRVRSAPLGPDEARTVLQVPEGVFHIGWVGRLSPEKGPDLLLEALGRLSDPGIRVSVLGDGRLRPELEARAQAGEGPQITFHGAVPDAGRLFPAFDLLVLSSRTEGTPIVLFEAMEASVPIVATAVGGVPDVLDMETARLVPPEDPAALARGILETMQDPPAAARRAARARERLHERYALEPWIDRHEELYQALTSTRAHTSPPGS